MTSLRSIRILPWQGAAVVVGWSKPPGDQLRRPLGTSETIRLITSQQSQWQKHWYKCLHTWLKRCCHNASDGKQRSFGFPAISTGDNEDAFVGCNAYFRCVELQRSTMMFVIGDKRWLRSRGWLLLFHVGWKIDNAVFQRTYAPRAFDFWGLLLNIDDRRVIHVHRGSLLRLIDIVEAAHVR